MSKRHLIQKDIIQDYYNQIYRATHYTGVLGRFTRSYHRKLEKPFQNLSFAKIIEIGANEGEHLIHVQSKFNEYIMVDLRYPKNTTSSEWFRIDCPQEKFKITKRRGNAEEQKFKDSTFDRAIFSCVLPHVGDSSSALSETRRILRHNGFISIYLPCDPGMVYRILRHFFSHIKQSKLQKSEMAEIKYLWSLEHKNHFPGLMSQIKWIFRNDKLKIQGFPFPKLSWNVNLYYIIHIQINKKLSKEN